MDNNQSKKSKKDQQRFEVGSQSMDNYGMLLEILSRLPVKSLLRFMCVCKNWKTLISSHPFRKVHREKHTSSPPLLISSYNTLELSSSPFLRKDLDYGKYNYLIISNLEGKIIEKITVPIPLAKFDMVTPPYQSKLLCYHNLRKTDIYLYNPSTRQSFLLTKPPSISSPDQFQSRHYSAELGYNPSKDEYIMVHLFKSSNGKLYCEVLNNITISNNNFKLHYDQWRSYIDPTISLDRVIGDGVFVGGANAFYWNVVIFGKKNIILSFDVETGCFSTIGVPPDQEKVIMYHATLLVLNGDLYLANYLESSATLTMWKLSCDNKLWTPFWEFDFERLFGFKRGEKYHSRFFRWYLFIDRLKYLKGYVNQPCDQQVSAEMGELRLTDGLKNELFLKWAGVSIHTNLFTL